jgi:hypothetical protein
MILMKLKKLSIRNGNKFMQKNIQFALKMRIKIKKIIKNPCKWF